jgi:hypothetical protein
MNGALVSFVAHQNNTAAATLSINGVSYSLLDHLGAALISGEVQIGSVQVVHVQTGGARLINPRLTSARTWAPVFAAPSGTWGATATYARYRYSEDGRGIYFSILDSRAVSATPSYTTFTLPIASANLGGNQNIAAHTNNTLISTGTVEVQNASTEARVYRGDRSAMATASLAVTVSNGFYWIA